MPITGRLKLWGPTWLLFLLLACALYGGSPSSQIRSVAISPDGKLLAVDFGSESTSYIYRVNVETGIASRLTSANAGEEHSPAFSPDGKRIAYTYWPQGETRSRIIIVDIDGSNPYEWPLSAANDLSPVFSPDNRTLIFSRSATYGSNSPVAQPRHHGWRFYAASLDGTNIRDITSESFYMVSPASVSADGKTMVVVTENLEDNQHIAIYPLNGAGVATRTLQPRVPNGMGDKPILTYPNYMPDGSVLFMAATKGRRGFDYDLYLVDVETESVKRLTEHNGYATALTVSADGRTAAFLKWRKNWLGDVIDSEVYLFDVQTDTLRPLEIVGLK